MKLLRIVKLSLGLLIGLLTLYSCDQLGELLGDEGLDGNSLYVDNFQASMQNGEILLTWGYNNEASGYSIYMSENEFGNYQSIGEVFNQNQYSINEFEPQRYYYFQVRIIDYNGNYHEFSHSESVYTGDDYGTGDGGGGSSGGQYIEQMNNWGYYDINNNEERWFYIEVAYASEISVELDDINSGQRNNDGDISFSLYESDQETIYNGMENLNNTDNTDVQVTLPQGQNRLYIRVNGQSSGSFALKFIVTEFSSESRLGSINVNQGSGYFTPEFSADTYEYEMIISESTTSVNFTQLYGLIYESEVTATIDGTNGFLSDGAFSVNNFTLYVPKVIVISVESTDGSDTSDYTFTITQASSNMNLTSLVFNDGTSINSFDQSYNDPLVTIPGNFENLTVIPTSEDDNAIITVNGVIVESGTESLPVTTNIGDNNNVFVIVVSAADGSGSLYYYVDVVKNFTGSFELIMDDAVEITFDENSGIYTVSAPIGLSSALLEVQPEDSSAIVLIDGVDTRTSNILLTWNFVEVTVPITVTPDNGSGTTEDFVIKITPSWTVDSPEDQVELIYYFDASAGQDYTVEWFDSSDDSDKFSEDIKVSAYRPNGSVITDLYNAVDNPVTFTSNYSETLSIRVSAQDDSIVNDFAIRVKEGLISDNNWINFKASSDTSIIVR